MENKSLTHAGCVVFRANGAGKSYLIISSKNGKHWVLPKGHIKKKKRESPEAAALRELAEEAGIAGEIVQPLPLQRFVKKGEEVVIQYFLVRQTGTTLAREERTIRWEDEKNALELLSFEEARRTLQKASEIIGGLS